MVITGGWSGPDGASAVGTGVTDGGLGLARGEGRGGISITARLGLGAVLAFTRSFTQAVKPASLAPTGVAFGLGVPGDRWGAGGVCGTEGRGRFAALDGRGSGDVAGTTATGSA